jgi:phage/conjugal plasmid C-4 type zinc finger TraR family protein
MEKYADVLDLAQAHTEREIELRIAAIQRWVGRGQACEICIDCGSPIPEARRRHVPGAERCATCQVEAERSRRPIPPRRT